MVIILMGIELFKTSIEKIFHPEPVETGALAVGILVVSICVKGYMCFYNRTVGKKIQSETMKATAMDSMSDSIATTAVLIGAIIYKACVAAALKFFEPQDMKLITGGIVPGHTDCWNGKKEEGKGKCLN